MPVVECPHCHKDVWPKSDRSCPACGKDTSDEANGTPDLMRLEVSRGTVFPDVCCTCGEPTTRIEKVTESVKRGDRDDRVWMILVLGLMAVFAWLLTKIWGYGSRFESTVTAEMPRCAACSKSSGPLVAESVDFDTNRMVFLVHKSFGELCEPR